MPPERTGAEWADQNRVMPTGSAIPGPWRTSVAPYMGKISIAVRDPATRWVTIMMGSQMGKTEGCLNEIGKKLDDDPEPILYIGPTQKNVQDKIEPRIVKMIDSAPALSSKMLRGKRSTKTCKRIAGVELYLGWAGSDTELSSVSAAMVLVDELGKMKDLKGSGDVVEQLDARMFAYPDSKGIVDSTPTEGTVESKVDPDTGFEHWMPAKPEDVQCPTWSLWQEGSREEFAVPCPDCDDFFIPRFKLLWWPEGCTANQALTEARLTCSRCGTHIEDKHREWMNEHGEFVGPGQKIVDGQVVGDLINITHRTFWTSGLMSPLRSFGQRASAWIKAAKSKKPSRIQGQINTGFGELFQISGEAPPWEAVALCRGEYNVGAVPGGVQRIFITVDVQGNRLIYIVRGWGYNWESWAIDHGEIYGETQNADDGCWTQLQALLDKNINGMPVTAMAIDSGYNTTAVDAFAKRNKSRVYATVGRDNPAKIYKPTPQETNVQGKTIKTGLHRWTLDHGHFKSWVHERLTWPQDQSGSWHIPQDGSAKFNDEYCKQIVAEHKIHFASGRTKWIQIRTDNHYLDCEYMQVFLATVRGIGNIKKPEAKENKSETSMSNFGASLNG